MKKQEQRIFSRQRAKPVPTELTRTQMEGVTGGRNGTVSFCEPYGHDDCDEI